MKNSYLYLVLLIFFITIIFPYQVEALHNNETLTQVNSGLSINYENRLVEDDICFRKDPDKINTVNSEVNIKNCSIIGVVDFRDTIFEKPVNFLGNEFNGSILTNQRTQFKKSAIFRDSKFNNYTDLSGANFSEEADFRRCKFNRSSFTNSNFMQDANFQDAQFNGSTNFNDANFRGDANFKNVVFNEFTSFSRSKFFKEAGFYNMTSKTYIDFTDARFDELADFQRAKINHGKWDNCNFSGIANFGGAEFSTFSFFRDAKFIGSANFVKSIFGDDASFKSSTFNGSSSFAGAIFKGCAEFSSSKFKEDADFRKVHFQGNQIDLIDFSLAQIVGYIDLSNIKIDECNLSLDRAKYNKMYVRWENLSGKLAYSDASYMTLIKNFKDLGLLDDVDACYYEFRNHRRIMTNLTAINQEGIWRRVDIGFRKFLEFFLDFLYRYGVDPLRPLILSVIVIIVFAVIWRVIGVGTKFSGNITKIHMDKVLPATIKLFFVEIFSLKEALKFSFFVFVSAAKFFVEITLPKIPKTIEEKKPWSKHIFSFERFAAGLLIALFFLAVSRTIVRDM